MAHISDIKLIRTDTTLDLSQKAEKGMLCTTFGPFFIRGSSAPHIVNSRCGINGIPDTNAIGYKLPVKKYCIL